MICILDLYSGSIHALKRNHLDSPRWSVTFEFQTKKWILYIYSTIPPILKLDAALLIKFAKYHTQIGLKPPFDGSRNRHIRLKPWWNVCFFPSTPWVLGEALRLEWIWNLSRIWVSELGGESHNYPLTNPKPPMKLFRETWGLCEKPMDLNEKLWGADVRWCQIILRLRS